MTKDGMVTAWSASMYMTKDGMVTAWSTGIYDQRWNGLSLECWYVRPKMEWSQPGVLVLYEQRWNGHSLECWYI